MEEIIENFNLLKKDQERLISQIKEEQISQEKMNLKLNKHEKFKEIIFSVRKKYIDRMREKFSSIQNLALKSIFPDRDYSFNLEIVQRRNKPNLDIEIHKFQQDKKVSVKLDRSGDGIYGALQISSIISSLILSDKERFLFVDEILNGISKKGNYFNNTLKWMKSVCDTFGIQVVFITHDTEVQSISDLNLNIISDNYTGYATVEVN